MDSPQCVDTHSLITTPLTPYLGFKGFRFNWRNDEKPLLQRKYLFFTKFNKIVGFIQQNSRFFINLLYISGNYNHSSRIYFIATIIYINQYISKDISNVNSSGFVSLSALMSFWDVVFSHSCHADASFISDKIVTHNDSALLATNPELHDKDIR